MIKKNKNNIIHNEEQHNIKSFCARQSGQSDLKPTKLPQISTTTTTKCTHECKRQALVQLASTLVTLTRPNGCVCNKPRAMSLCAYFIGVFNKSKWPPRQCVRSNLFPAFFFIHLFV